MSGGVDSSVAAALMIKQGYECIGATMKLHDAVENMEANEEGACDKEGKTCCSLDDILDAKAVASRLNMRHYVMNFKDDFKCNVIDKFVESYLKGITPNPCIDCNRNLKFERLYRRAQELGCDVIVTGHYARIRYNEETNRYELMKAVDSSKDQSYVLYNLTQEQLAHTVFPLGEYTKDEIRAMAQEMGFINAKKHDSQDICFIPDGNYKRFIEEYSGQKCEPGNFVDESGKILGQHTGICNYTIGQRKGLGISFSSPLFVKEIRVKENEIVLSDNDALFTDSLLASDFNWISKPKPGASEEYVVEGKVRYKHNPAKASCKLEDENVRVTFEEAQRAITCGQAVVLYDGDIVVGGGTIISTR